MAVMLTIGANANNMCKIAEDNTIRMLNKFKVVHQIEKLTGILTGTCSMVPQMLKDFRNTEKYCKEDYSEPIKIYKKLWDMCELKGFINYNNIYRRENRTPEQQVIQKMIGW